MVKIVRRETPLITKSSKLNTEVMFSSDSTEWSTPQDLFDALDEEFNFSLDVCATKENAKCRLFFTKDDDGLSFNWRRWSKRIWLNPPYGKQIGEWMRKACEAALNGSIVVCLIPVRSDTRYWHDYCMKAKEIRFIQGRLKFGESKNSAPFPSAIVIFKPGEDGLRVTSYKTV